MSEANKAVFLSYASQDTEAAKRICEALRAAGVEVWFDQSELVGGDAWDQKIRKQIKDCALLIPIISAATQARTEGYFRLEWRLADQRTHLMAKGRAFLLPVVIDDTRDADAHVPDSFTEVQWTRLKGGETPVAFAERVRKLLGGGTSEDRGQRTEVRTTNPLLAGESRRRPWLVPAIVGAVVIAVATVWLTRKPAPASGLPPPASTAAPAAALTEAQKLVAQARSVYESGDALNRENLYFAEDLLKRAQALDPTEPTAWEFAARLSYQLVWFAIENTEKRRELLVQQANRALALAPQSVPAQLAVINARLAVNFNRMSAATGFERDIEALAAREPGNWRVQSALGTTYRFTNRPEKSLASMRRALELSDGDPEVAADLINVLWRLHFYPEAVEVAAVNLRAHSSARLMAFDAFIKQRWRGDVAAAKKELATFPAWMLQEDRGVFLAWQVAMWSREPELAQRAAQGAPRDYVRGFAFYGPRAVLTALAHEMAGNAEAARADWQIVLDRAGRELADEPENDAALYWKAWALARLGQTAEARTLAARVQQLNQNFLSAFAKGTYLAPLLVAVGQPDAALAEIKARMGAMDDSLGLTRATLELDPAYDPLRSDPRFQELVRLAPAPASSLPSPSHPPEVDAKSVAVLAFANLSDDKANEYFSDGISEELLNVLAKVPQLKVAARTSSFYFKGRNEPIPEIAQKLGVAYVVEGSVRKAGNKVRVTAQLIKAADGYHVWSETYDRDLTDIFAVQDEIAKNILGVVKGSLLGEAELPHATLTNIEAYTLYLQAQGQFAKRGDEGLREAIRLYEASLKIDPHYVPALVGLAQAYVVLPNYAYLSGAKARETTEGAIKAARRVLELEPQNAAAFAVIGWAGFQFDWKWVESEAALRRARDLAPNDSWTWNCLGDYYRYVGDLPQAQVAKQREYDLDPLSQNSHWDQSYLQLVAGHYDQAIHWAEICVGLAPHNVDSYMPAILAAGRAGRFDLMHRTMAAARQNVHEGEGMLLLLEAYAAILEKKAGEARRLLAAVSTLADNENASPAYLGYCYLLLGEVDQAVVWLQKGYDRHDPAMVWTEIIDFDVIAANPRTRPILDQPGLKELFELRQRNARAGLNKL